MVGSVVGVNNRPIVRDNVSGASTQSIGHKALQVRYSSEGNDLAKANECFAAAQTSTDPLIKDILKSIKG